MAARKKKRARAAKRKAAPARKPKAAARKSAKRPAKKAKKTARKSVKSAAKKAPAKKARSKAQTKGEGDYAASRAFLKDQAGFVEKNKDRIPAMGKAAESALEGPDGAGLRDAEATAAARSRDIF